MRIMKQFENTVDNHSLQPFNSLYNSNALCGECGEAANIVKKMQFEKIKPEWIRDDIKSIPDLKKALADELSDSLFYITRLAKDNGYTLKDLADIQKEKLETQSKKYNRKFLK